MATIKKIYKNGVEYQMPQGMKGEQGDSAIFDPDTGNVLATLASTTGKSTTNAMTQKAVTGELTKARVLEGESSTFFHEVKSLGETLNKYINSSDAWASSSNTNNQCSFIPVTPGDVYKVIAGANQANIEFMTTNDTTSSPPTFVSERIGWLDEGTYYITVPAGAAYMYIRRKLSGTSVTPTLRIVSETVKERLQDIVNNALVHSLTQITLTEPPSGASNQRYIDRNTNKWVAQASKYIGGILSAIPGQTYKIVAGTSTTGFAFLSSNSNTAGTTPSYATGCREVVISPGDTVFATAPSDARYIYFDFRYGDTSGYPSMPSYFGKVVSVKEQVAKNTSNIATIQDIVYDNKEITLPNGGFYIDSNKWVGSTSNSNGVIVSTTPLKTYKIVVSSSVNTQYAWLQGNDKTKNATPQYSDGCSVESLAAGGTYEITAPADGYYLYIRKKMSGSYTTTYVGEVATVKDLMNASGNEESLIKHATYIRSGSEQLQFNILHYSDIHGSSVAAKGIAKAITVYGGYIDEVLNTGDVIYSIIGSSTGNLTWWQNCGLQSMSLFTPGNHDDLVNNDTRAREGKAYLHTNYFPASIIEDLGYVMPDGYNDSTSPNYQACFWHKDYSEQKIRLIGLDCMDKFDGEVNPSTGEITVAGTTTNEQEVWLAARLAETLTGSGDDAEGYTVIVCSHYTLDDYDVTTYGENMEWDDTNHKWVCNHKSTGGRVINQKTLEVTNWHRQSMKLRESAATMRWANENGHNNIGEIIEHYIAQQGSHFAAFVCGHTHNNLFFYPKKFPNVLNVCIDMAGNLRDMNYANQGTMGGYIANFLSFNTTGGLLRIVRLGVKSDLFLTPINFICYDYINRRVVSEG